MVSMKSNLNISSSAILKQTPGENFQKYFLKSMELKSLLWRKKEIVPI